MIAGYLRTSSTQQNIEKTSRSEKLFRYSPLGPTRTLPMNRSLLILVPLCLALSTPPILGQGSTAKNQPTPEALAPAPDNAPIRKKLSEIIIPSIDLQDTPLPLVIAFLNSKSIELDPTVAEATGDDPFGGGKIKAEADASVDARRGVNIVLLEESANDPNRTPDPSRAAVRAITAEFADIPLGEAINLIGQLAACKVRVDTHAVVLIPLKPGEFPEFAADDPEMIAKQREHLSSIILPSIEFADTPLRHALEFLSQKSAELDPRPPKERSFNLVLRARPGTIPPAEPVFDPGAAPGPEQDLGDIQITLRLKRIPVLDALQYIAEIAGLEVIIGNTIVVIQPAAIEQQ